MTEFDLYKNQVGQIKLSESELIKGSDSVFKAKATTNVWGHSIKKPRPVIVKISEKVVSITSDDESKKEICELIR